MTTLLMTLQFREQSGTSNTCLSQHNFSAYLVFSYAASLTPPDNLHIICMANKQLAILVKTEEKNHI